MSLCKECGKELTKNDLGLSKKLINRGTTEFYCIDCLSVKFDCPKEILLNKIEQFKKSGCVLFL